MILITRNLNSLAFSPGHIWSSSDTHLQTCTDFFSAALRYIFLKGLAHLVSTSAKNSGLQLAVVTNLWSEDVFSVTFSQKNCWLIIVARSVFTTSSKMSSFFCIAEHWLTKFCLKQSLLSCSTTLWKSDLN